jgi:hypothetical protein
MKIQLASYFVYRHPFYINHAPTVGELSAFIKTDLSEVALNLRR